MSFECRLCNKRFKLFRNLLKHIEDYGLTLREYLFITKRVTKNVTSDANCVTLGESN
jgi:hypothetical protein